MCARRLMLRSGRWRRAVLALAVCARVRPLHCLQLYCNHGRCTGASVSRDTGHQETPKWTPPSSGPAAKRLGMPGGRSASALQ